MQFRPKPHLAAILGLLAACSTQSQASRRHVPAGQPVQPPATPNTVPAASPGPSPAARQLVVEGMSIGGDFPFQLQVRTNAGVTPQAQVITGPDRLVIDVPGATPGRALRNQTVNQSQVERVRVGLFSASPRVTRIVLDLNSPMPYHIQTDPSGFTVTLAANTPASEPANTDRQPIGWVKTGSPAASAAARPNPIAISNSAAVPVNTSEVRVVGGTGQLEIHARNATLSEVLLQVEQQTGAEIAIPAGIEQQRVIGDFGPGAESEVLAELLNGSDLNFVVVGSPDNPYALRRVILTHKSPGGPDPPRSDNTPPFVSYTSEVPQVPQPEPTYVPPETPPQGNAPAGEQVPMVNSIPPEGPAPQGIDPAGGQVPVVKLRW